MSGEAINEDSVPHYDAHLQLDAIHGLLRHVREWRDVLRAEPDQARDGDEYAGAMAASVYADAAYCHAAVGALAPFFEGMFAHEIRCLRSHYFEGACPKSYDRWHLQPDDFWNIRKLEEDRQPQEKENVHSGTIQLLKAIGIIGRFPPDFRDVTEVLFAFRNQALHNGYEWPPERREAFARRIDSGRWKAEWFSKATTNGEPWIFYLEDVFFERCLALARAGELAFSQARMDWIVYAASGGTHDAPGPLFEDGSALQALKMITQEEDPSKM